MTIRWRGGAGRFRTKGSLASPLGRLSHAPAVSLPYRTQAPSQLTGSVQRDHSCCWRVVVKLSFPRMARCMQASLYGSGKGIPIGNDSRNVLGTGCKGARYCIKGDRIACRPGNQARPYTDVMSRRPHLQAVCRTRPQRTVPLLSRCIRSETTLECTLEDPVVVR